MRALKTLVVVMGVMLVVGFVALVIAIAERVSNKGARHAAAPAAPTQAVTAPTIDLPTGAHIETMTAGSDRLVLDIALSGGEHRLLILDLATGRTLLTVPLHTAPQP